MTTLVVGAGVIGLATAYALHKDGVEVHVLERLDGPGQATSFGNAGGLCPGFAGPWAAPGMVSKAIKWMVSSSAPLKVRPRLDLAQWAWLARFAYECQAERSAQNKRAMQAIAHYSQDTLAALIEDTGISFDHGKGGVLQTFRSDQTLQAGQRAARVLGELGIEHRLIEPHALAQIEPALATSSTQFKGGLHLPHDQTGDCAAFCEALMDWLSDRGVRFSFGVDVTAIACHAGAFTTLKTCVGDLTGEQVVLTAGPFANRLLKPLKRSQPIYPVKGYSLTYTLPGERVGIRSSVMDEDSKLMFTRLGTRLRVGGLAEVSGFETSLEPKQIAAITFETEMLFPDVKLLQEPQAWSGLRPMTPDGRARIGAAAGLDGVWLNLGHGSNGWTQAAGAGQLLADLVAGRTPAIDAAPYRPN
ncbi:MAG: D-amino acid dehydrogenase [Pseudomonadota bacterium]